MRANGISELDLVGQTYNAMALVDSFARPQPTGFFSRAGHVIRASFSTVTIYVDSDLGSNWTAAMLKRDVIKTNGDLSALFVACRIATLENKPLPPDQNKTLGKQLLDPFSKRPYLWSNTRQQHYSVGPDRTDNKMQKAWEGADETLGDIWLK